MNDVTIQILQALNEEKMTQRRLARAIGVSESRVSQMLRRQPNLNLGTLDQIAAALGREVRVLLVKPPTPMAEWTPCDDCTQGQDGERWCTMNCSSAPIDRRIRW